MRVVVQRVLEGKVTVDGKVSGQIGRGFVLFVGISYEDDDSIVRQMAAKVRKLRIMDDANGKMNLALDEESDSVLSISQFTLYADLRGCNRPGFTNAMKPDEADRLYRLFNEELRKLGLKVETGIFQADMKVSLVNDGPVTIIIDSREVFRHG